MDGKIICLIFLLGLCGGTAVQVTLTNAPPTNTTGKATMETTVMESSGSSSQENTSTGYEGSASQQVTTTPAPTTTTPAPTTTTPAPDTTTPAPTTTTPAPTTTTPAPTTTTPAPDTTTPAPTTTTPAPTTTTPAPTTTTPAPDTTTPAPDTTTPAPDTTTPATTTSILVLHTTTPAPTTTTPAPDTTSPETTTTAPPTTTGPCKKFKPNLSKADLTKLFNSPVYQAERVVRRLGKLPFVIGPISHTGVRVTLCDGSKWLIHKGHKYGKSSDTVVTSATNMSKRWSVLCTKNFNGKKTVSDLVKAGGAKFSLFSNCHRASKKIMSQ